MKIGSKPLDDDTIGVLIDGKIRDATAWYSSKLSNERERVTRYINEEFPRKQSAGSSSYVSPEVYNSVGMMSAQLLETFAGGHDIVRFDPVGPDDIETARVATAYTKHVVFSQNDGYSLFHDAIFDGLTTRVGVAKVYWEEDCEYEDHEFKDLHPDEVEGLVSQEGITDLEATADDAGMYSGKLTRKIDKGQVKILVVNPEEFSVEPHSRRLSKDYFCCHKQLRSYDSLLREGYPKAVLDKCQAMTDDEINRSPEALARFSLIDSGVRPRPDDFQEGTRQLQVFECYLMMQRKGDKHLKYYKVLRCGGQTLDIEEVDDHPFVAWSPLPIPHSFYGDNFAKRVIPTQNIRSVLVRAIVDHTSITVNPRYTVLKGGLTNPKELLDNRLGGLVNVTRPDAVNPLVTAPLNPYVYQTLELLRSQNETTTGISSLSQGLNKDAVSNQNSQGLVTDLVNMSQTRQKVIARNFANQFVIPLWLKVYSLVIANETKQNIVEVAGDWAPVDPRQWAERKTATASLHLGYGELDREADKRIQMAAMIAQDPQLNRMFEDKGRYRLAADIFDMKGVKNVNDYLTPPERLQPPQPDPMKVMEMQNEAQKAQAALVTAKAAEDKVQMHGKIEAMRATLDKMQREFDNSVKSREQARKDIDIANKIDVAQREMDMAEQSPAEDNNVIVSPR